MDWCFWLNHILELEVYLRTRLLRSPILFRILLNNKDSWVILVRATIWVFPSIHFHQFPDLFSTKRAKVCLSTHLTSIYSVSIQITLRKRGIPLVQAAFFILLSQLTPETLHWNWLKLKNKIDIFTAVRPRKVPRSKEPWRGLVKGFNTRLRKR